MVYIILYPLLKFNVYKIWSRQCAWKKVTFGHHLGFNVMPLNLPDWNQNIRLSLDVKLLKKFYLFLPHHILSRHLTDHTIFILSTNKCNFGTNNTKQMRHRWGCRTTVVVGGKMALQRYVYFFILGTHNYHIIWWKMWLS